MEIHLQRTIIHQDSCDAPVAKDWWMQMHPLQSICFASAPVCRTVECVVCSCMHKYAKFEFLKTHSILQLNCSKLKVSRMGVKFLRYSEIFDTLKSDFTVFLQCATIEYKSVKRSPLCEFRGGGTVLVTFV